MTGTRNPSRKYFKRNQPYFYKSADNWEEWDTDESYDRTFFIGIDDSNPEDIDVALYMIWGGKAVAAVGSRVLNTVNDVVDTARQLEEEIQSILEEVQEIVVALIQARIDLDEALAEMNALVDRCEGILEDAEAARDLAKDWAVKMNGMVVEDGESVDYSAKYYANEAKNSETVASTSAVSALSSAGTATEQATAASTSAGQAAISASTAASYAASAHIDASGAATSAQAAQDSATSAATSATNAANSETNSADSAAISANSAQAAQDALDEVRGLIAIPIGTIFQSVYVDESLDMARALTGQLISSTKFTGFRVWLNKVQAAIPNLFTTETNWQAEKALSKFGQVGKFVIDDENQTIRLPAVVNAQGLLDLTGIGNLVDESLPNITGTVTQGVGNSISWNAALANDGGALYGIPATTMCANAAGVSGAFSDGIGIDASRSSTAYQDGANVQQEAIQYPYYIQVATGIEEELPAIREYKINTPFFFGQSMYSENVPYNASWLLSNGQYNAKSTYPDMWTQLQVELNSSLNEGDTAVIDGKTYVKRGLPVKLSTDTYDDYDWIVNTADETFRLPLLDGSEDLSGDMFENITYDGHGSEYTATKNGHFSIYGYGSTAYIFLHNKTSTAFSDCTGSTNSSSPCGCSVKCKKGDTIQAGYYNGTITTFGFTPATGNGSLYFYVGDTVQDASLINAGVILGQLANKADIDASNFNADGKSLLSGLGMPSGRYINLTLGANGATYTAPANGWIYYNVAASAGGWFSMGNVHIGTTALIGSASIRCSIPVKRGMIITINYSLTNKSSEIFRFVYAEGEPNV